MRRLLAATAAIGLLALQGASAQQRAPFDMSGERPPAPPEQAGPPAAAPPAEGVAPASVPPAQPPAAALRHLLPTGNAVLAGENPQRSWSVYLTPEQAAGATEFGLGYQNSLVVAPEISRLRMTVNGNRLFDVAVASSDAVSRLSAPVPAGLLRAGFNDIKVETVQRHRTDCTIQSTYELWTQLDPASTVLRFADASVMRWTRTDDLRAIGVDVDGRTAVNLVVPAVEGMSAAASALRLAQGLALFADMPNLAVSVTTRDAPARRPGTATVLMGTTSELSPLLSAMPAGAATGATAAFVDDPGYGPGTLVVTGPSWQAIDAAIDTMARPVDRDPAMQRTALATRNWRLPEPPMLFGERRLTFADLGIQTQEFSGRRFRTEFAFGVPSDFFASSYGEANILLDAAYSEEVLPGSHIDIYVNDNIAATMPITTAGGEILRHLPIKVTMRHFRPGANTIAIEAVLMTDADRVCAPGATALDKGRFVIFDTSEFAMPAFARIAQRPNLAALAGTAFPYGRATAPVPLIVDRGDANLSAAATLAGKLAAAAGRLIPLDLNVSPASVAGRDALFIAPISQLPQVALTQAGIAEASRVSWGDAPPPAEAGGPTTEATFDQWRERLSGSGWRGQISTLEEWLNRTFDVSLESFRLLPSRNPEFTPGGDASLVVAQSAAPGGTGTWTLFTAPTAAALQDGMRAVGSAASWAGLGGYISSYNASNGKVTRIEPASVELVQSAQGSFANYRLIIANWLSANAVSYSLVLGALCILLGLATALMLRTLGRDE
jgi:hypothetical protein